MTNTTLEDRICLASSAIYQQPMLLPVLVCILAANALTILLGALLLFLLLKHPASFHWNTRALLINLSAALLINLVLMSVGSISHHSFYLVRVRQNKPSCPFFEKPTTCAIFEYIRVGSVLCVQLSLVSIAFERALATWKYKTYEGIRNPVLLLIAIVSQWVLATFVVVRTRSGPLEWVPSCNTLVFGSGASSVLPSVMLLLIMESSAGAIYLGVLYVNKKKQETTLINQDPHTLTIRYQLSENIRATRMMLPSLLAHMICFVPMLLIVILLVSWHGGNLDLDPYRVQVTNLILTATSCAPFFYGMFHPIICILRTPKFHQSIFTKNTVVPSGETRVKKCEDVVTGHQWNPAESTMMNEEGEHHFRMLSLMWKTQN